MSPQQGDSSEKSLAERIEDILPQTQCTKCGYDGCRPYAQAIAAGAADINQCPPGGAQGIQRLAQLLGRPIIPLSPVHGVEKPRELAIIDEQVCIGCTLCIQACPVDAIVGAAKQMHTVIAAQCTGCELCVPPCPVDCIAMVPLVGSAAEWTTAQADAARAQHDFHLLRLDRDKQEKSARLASRHASPPPTPSDPAPDSAAATDPAKAAKQALIAAAMARAQAARAHADAAAASSDTPPPSKPEHS